MNRNLAKIVISLIAAGCLIVSSVQARQAGVKVACLISDSLKSTTRTLQGAQKVIRRNNPDVRFHTFCVSNTETGDLAIVDSVNHIAPILILTVGSSATRFAADHFKETPIVFSAVKYPVLSGFVSSTGHPGGNITGASLNIPDDVQFKYFKRIIPKLRTLGVLYTRNTEALIPQARVIAQRLGLDLVPIMVNENKELPAALDSLAATVDGIWSVADPNLFNSKSTRYIITNTLRRQIPFMGFSRNVVESGALFSLDFDYKAIGFQAGETAVRIINGEKPGDISVTTTDLIWFHFNEKTAHHINVKVPDELVSIAKEVYR
ncbi:MAG: ABC transporter substrate-binding protein [candidate division Zixibacteria bacterium]|nr:ABC transporter substrate-binding protein [candidate division Zixibacteria bacterium]